MKQADGHVSHFLIVPALIHGDQGSIELEVCCGIERKPTIADVAPVFVWVVRNPHCADCTYTIAMSTLSTGE